MNKTKTGQVNTSAAEVYEEFFIPAIFQEWAEKVADEAKIEKGQKVLDVACGTGVLAREVFERVGAEGSVTGLDLNEGMLAVAEKKNQKITWQYGVAESIPFEDESFERVVSQFGLMFFVDKALAIKEMFRVLKSGGKLSIAVWGKLENAVGYQRVVELLEKLFGVEVANALRSPYSLGDVQLLKGLFEQAEVQGFEIKTLEGKANFPSIESWMFTDVKGWTLAEMIDDEQYELLLKEAKQELKSFMASDGSVSFNHPAHIVSATKI